MLNILKKKTKGFTSYRSLGTILGLIIGLALFYIIFVGIASGQEAAADAATSCHGWQSELSDAAGVDLC
jgi:hypothetical protein